MELESTVIASNAPAFVLKLWKLVGDPNVDDLISWSKEGTAFCVHDPVAFAKDVLPFYFKHSNFTSFVRQLNMYGFKKLVSTDHGGIRSENPEWEFYHQYFMQGKVEWLENIKRKVHPEEKKVKNEDVSNIIEDVKNLHVKHGEVQTQFEALKMENEVLWSELSELRQTHRKQQHVINKLINFLILLYGRKGVHRRKRLAIAPVRAPFKRPRMSPPHPQIEELENVKYLVESPKSVNNTIFSLDSEDDGEGPLITMLPDEPAAQSSKSSFMANKNLQKSTPAAESSTARSSLPIRSERATQSTAVVKKLPPVQVIPTVQVIPNPESSAVPKQVSTISTSPFDKKRSAVAKPNKPLTAKDSAQVSPRKAEKSLKLQMPTMVSLTKEPVIDFSPSFFENIGQIFPSDTNISNFVVDDKLQELESSYDQPNAVVLKRSKSTDRDIIDQDVDHINHSLDSLQTLLSEKHYNIDPNLLSQVFDPYGETLDTSSLPGNATVEDLQEATDSYEDNDTQEVAPFSPGMFLNDVGESSSAMRDDIEPEDSSLLS